MLKKIMYIMLAGSFIQCIQTYAYTIMLSAEKNNTHDLSYIKSIKKRIIKTFPRLTVQIEEYDPSNHVSNITDINSSNADFYLYIKSIKTADKQYQISIYQYINNPTDFWQKKLNNATLIPLNNAHYNAMHRSKKWGEIVQKIISENYKKTNIYFNAIPYKPLFGIIIPAIGIEISTPTPQNIEKSITQALISIINEIKKIP